MTRNKQLVVHFFEGVSNNIVANLFLTLLGFAYIPKNSGSFIIPSLLFTNVVWIFLLIYFRIDNNHFSKRGKALLVHLTAFYILSCLLWLPKASGKFFIISSVALNIIVLALHITRKPLHRLINQILSNSGIGRSIPGILAKVKMHLFNDTHNRPCHSAFNVLQGSQTGAVMFNLKNNLSPVDTFIAGKDLGLSSVLADAEYNFGNIQLGDTMANWAIALPYRSEYKETIPARQINNRMIKRLLDIGFSLFVIVFLLSWMIPLIGLLIKVESKGPVFFKQLRSGLNNKPFWCYKFRSMRMNEVSDELQATRHDHRITRIGSFLRKTSLDEFPQFINILKGEMSIVGPRPHMLKHTEMYSGLIENYMDRLSLKQGLTGWAQIKGLRGETSNIKFMEDRVRHDLWYMRNWSLWLDIKIIVLTFGKIFKTDETAF